jgi:hypothetical protein
MGSYLRHFGTAYQSKMTVTNYQSTLHNIPEEQMPHGSVYFPRSVPGHGQMYIVITQERSQENVNVNAQDTYYEQGVSIKLNIYIH